MTPIRVDSGREVPSLVRAGAVLTGVWAALALGGALAGAFGVDVARTVGFALALAATRESPGGRDACAARPALAPLASGLGFAAGWLGFPACVAAIAAIGLALGLPPRAAAPPDGSPLVWLALVGLAPVFEERLHRGVLFEALRPRIGAPLAVAATSLLFAAPHGERWNVLGAGFVGLGLGALRARTGALGLCIAIHAGLNAAALACGAPPERLALAPAVSAPLAAAGLALALAARAPRPGSAVPEGASSCPPSPPGSPGATARCA